MKQVTVNKQSLQRQLGDYVVALALLFEVSILYGSAKLAAKLGLVHIQSGKVAEATIIRFKEER